VYLIAALDFILFFVFAEMGKKAPKLTGFRNYMRLGLMIGSFVFGVSSLLIWFICR